MDRAQKESQQSLQVVLQKVQDLTVKVPAHDEHLNVKQEQMQLLKEQLGKAKDEKKTVHQQLEHLSDKSEGVKRDLIQSLDTGREPETHCLPPGRQREPFS